MGVNGIISSPNQGLAQDPAQDPFRVHAVKNTLIRLHIFSHIALESIGVNGIISSPNQGLSQDPAQDPFRVQAEKKTQIRLHIFSISLRIHVCEWNHK